MSEKIELYKSSLLDEKRTVLIVTFRLYKSLVNKNYSTATADVEILISFLGKDEEMSALLHNIEERNYGYARTIVETMMGEFIYYTAPSVKTGSD